MIPTLRRDARSRPAATPAVRAVVAVSLIVGATLAFDRASGFSLTVHEQVVRAALRPGLDLDPAALNVIVDANLASDDHQTEPERHFDNAPTTADICGRWLSGVDTWLNEAVAAIEPDGDEKQRLKNRPKALMEFGLVLHATADFYSHSNYVELGLPAPPPGFMLASCLPHALPPELQTGYFSLVSVSPPQVGCPSTISAVTGGYVPQPPAPFRYCHAQLNKDEADRPGHATAVAYATQATRNAWEELHRRVIERYSPDETVDAECLFTKFAWGQDRSCHRIWTLDGRVTQQWMSPVAGPPIGDLALQGVTVQIQWTPTRYRGPLEPVYAPVRVDYKASGPVSVALTWPPQCTGLAAATDASTESGRLEVRPEATPIELNRVGLDLDVESIAMRCTRPQDRGFRMVPDPICVFADHARLPLAPSLQAADFDFGCNGAERRSLSWGTVTHAYRFTGTMKPAPATAR